MLDWGWLMVNSQDIISVGDIQCWECGDDVFATHKQGLQCWSCETVMSEDGKQVVLYWDGKGEEDHPAVCPVCDRLVQECCSNQTHPRREGARFECQPHIKLKEREANGMNEKEQEAQEFLDTVEALVEEHGEKVVLAGVAMWLLELIEAEGEQADA